MPLAKAFTNNSLQQWAYISHWDGLHLPLGEGAP